MNNLRIKRLQEHLLHLEQLKSDCRGAVALFAPMLYDVVAETIDLLKWTLSEEDRDWEEGRNL